MYGNGEAIHFEDLKQRHQEFRAKVAGAVKQEIGRAKVIISDKLRLLNGAAQSTRRNTRYHQTLGEQDLSLADFLTCLEELGVKIIARFDEELALQLSEITTSRDANQPDLRSSRSQTQVTEDDSQPSHTPTSQSLSEAEGLYEEGPTTQAQQGAPACSNAPLPGVQNFNEANVSSSSKSIHHAASRSSSPLSHMDSAELDDLGTIVSPIFTRAAESGHALRPLRQIMPHYPLSQRNVKKRNATSGSDRAQPKKLKCSVEIAALSASLLGPQGIRQFWTHITTWRSFDNSPRSQDFNTFGSSWEKQAAQYWKLAETLGNSSNLHQILSLIAKIRVAITLDQAASAMGYKKAPASMISSVLTELGQEVTKGSRRNLQERLKKPRKLMKVFGSYLGLLPFVPLEDGDVTVKNFQILSDSQSDTEHLQSLLQASPHTVVLSRIGQRFQECVLSCERFPEMVWEHSGLQACEQVAADDLMELMKWAS